jgi:hypothetical protein
MRTAGITLIEVLVLLLVLSLVVIGTVLGGLWYSWGGFLLGGIGLVVAFYLVIFVCYLVRAFIWIGIPSIPKCRNGSCRKNDYHPVEIKPGKWVERCKCGDYYEKRGRRFVRVEKDGNIKPYLKWIPFLGWKREK